MPELLLKIIAIVCLVWNTIIKIKNELLLLFLYFVVLLPLAAVRLFQKSPEAEYLSRQSSWRAVPEYRENER